MTFTLVERADGRVVLINTTPSKTDKELNTLSAPDWRTARESVESDLFFHDHGHGYFETPRPTAYLRANDKIDRENSKAKRYLVAARVVKDAPPPLFKNSKARSAIKKSKY